MSAIAPSLECVPGKYNAGLLFSQLPMDGSGDLTVTRTTTPTAGQSTRVNAAGLIELVPDNIPRLDYLQPDGTVGCPALLVEPSATNSMFHSQSINSWPTKTGLTITDNNAISPDGTQNASYIQQTIGGNVVSLISPVVTVASSQPQCVSFYAKAGQVTSATLQFGTPALWVGSVRVRFAINLLTGVITIVSGTGTASSVAVGNGWYKYSVVTAATVGSGTTSIQTVTGTIFSPNSEDGFYLWGAQWEQNSLVPTSYIPTTTAAVTRNADVIRKTNIASLIGQSEGTVYFEVEVMDEARNRWICTLDSVGNNFIQIWINASRQISVQIQNAGLSVMTTLISSVLSIGYHKFAFAYNTATNGCEMFIDGVQNPVASRTVTGAGLPAFNDFRYGGYIVTGSDTLKARIRAGALYPTRRSNVDLGDMTALYQTYAELAASLSYTVI